jgi:hypothetical protein
MAAISRTAWNRGWVPSGDFINGPNDGLARMDNLQLDEEGALTLVPGIVDIYDFSSRPHTIFSKFFGSNKFRYTINANGDITRNGSVLVNGADSNRGAFATSRGFVLIASGGVRKKDDTVDTFNLGIITPDGTPSIEVASQQRTELTALGDSTSANTDAAFVATAEPTLLTPDSTVANTEAPLATDGVKMNVRIGDTSKLIKVRLQFNLDASSGETDFFYYEWENVASGPFMGGINAWSSLTAKRGDFKKAGESLSGWTELNSIKVQFFFTDAVANNLVNEIHTLGGDQGLLNDAYDYTQVYVTNNGKYIGKSSEGPFTGAVWVSHGHTVITPHTSNATDDVNEIWTYRRTTRQETAHRPIGASRSLDRFYRINVSHEPFNTFEDNMSDEDALQQETLKLGMLSVQNLTEDIIGMVGDYNGRVLYLTPNNVYLSEINNPDLIDPTISFRVSGDDTTTNLWIRVVDSGRILVGATTDIFEIAGTLVDLPDGSIDVGIRRLGVSHPPLTREAATYQGAIFYYSSQGIVQLAGSTSEVISQNLNLLFDGKICYGIAPVRIVANAGQIGPLTVGKNKLFTALELMDGTRWCFIYDITKKYWIPYFTDPQSFFTEEDGKVIAGYNLPNPALREIYTYDDTSFARSVVFQTFHDDDNLPRNRKDVFTLKFTADTGGDPVNVSVAKNGSEQYYTVMNQVTFTGREEKFITIAETIGLGKSFSVKFAGLNLTTCKIYNFSIEYDARPEQKTYHRFNYTNLGTASRKRFVNFPFEIDTLGNTCEYIPLIDGAIAGESSTFSFQRKATHIHYFDTDSVGTDIGGIICGFFELYGPRIEDIISEKMPNPVTYLRIPQTDYGTPNRKRHSSYKFRINTRGAAVTLTPRLDGVDWASFSFSTTEPTVVEYFFTQDVYADPIAINIGGVLESQTDPKTPFEFYDVIKPDVIEVLPPRLKEFRIPETNYGVASKKRVRVIPYEINTNGSDVTFTPLTDNISGTPSIVNTATKSTVYHYFTSDVFCTDVAGRLDGTEPFEFYGLMKPEVVETLPVPRRFDQIGPLRFDKLAKFQALRIRVITTPLNGETSLNLPYKILIENEATLLDSSASVGEYSNNIVTIPNHDDVYEVPLPKTVNGTIFRIEIGPMASPFYMYDVQVKLVLSGMNADPKWIKAFSSDGKK